MYTVLNIQFTSVFLSDTIPPPAGIYTVVLSVFYLIKHGYNHDLQF